MDKFWWSGETQADVGDAFAKTMKAIAAELNRLLADVSFGGKAEQWAFIPIILEEDNLDYDEVVKKTSRGKVLEFRLKISHAEFLSATPSYRIHLVFDALRRSVTLMEKLGVPTATRRTLEEVLSQAGKNLHSDPTLELRKPADRQAREAREQQAQSDAPGAEMLKLYKIDRDGNMINYWEAWKADHEVIIHWGTIGTRGNTRAVTLSAGQDVSSIMQTESAQPRAEDYREITNEQMFQIVIQFQIVDMGTTDDLEKRYRVEQQMNQRLGWTGLGFCGGGDVGSGTMNVFCFVVDSAKALPIITAELKSLGVLDETTIALISDDHEQVVWPTDFRGKFAM